MSKRKKDVIEYFGERLAQLRFTRPLDTFVEREKLEQRVDSQTHAQRNPSTQGARP
jgi:hypothetical protein